jgi:cell division protein ZipA
MEDNFRNVLIILSAIVITAIFIHGLWTIRKQKNPYKLKTTKNKIEPLTRDFDRTGFDQDGVGQTKVTKHESSSFYDIDNEKEQNSVEGTQNASVFSTQEINSSVNNGLDGSIENDWFKENNRAQFTKGELGDELAAMQYATQPKKTTETKVIVDVEPLYKQPVTQAKPIREPIKKAKAVASKETLKRSQIEIDFENQVARKTEATKVKSNQLKSQIIILSVVMPANQQIFGAALLPSLLTLGLKYGEMNVFHRHEDNAGNGRVTFSLANIMNPGSFDLDSMETFATRGVSLFMTLPNTGDPFKVFEQMLNAAKQLATEFKAQVIDDKRNVMTKQTEQHYLSRIREFDRKSCVAMME